jgi:hypothetical protein
VDPGITNHARPIRTQSPWNPMIDPHDLALAAGNGEQRTSPVVRDGHSPSRHRLGGLLKGCAIALAAGALLLGAVAYCGFSLYSVMKAEMPLVEGKATAWMTAYNASDFAACYRDADGALRSASSETDYSARLAALRGQTGAVTLGSRTGFFMNTNNGDTTARCTWEATGEHGPVVVEFQLHKAPTWKVSGFQITIRP